MLPLSLLPFITDLIAWGIIATGGGRRAGSEKGCYCCLLRERAEKEEPEP